MTLTVEADSLPFDGPTFTTPEAAINYARASHNRAPNNDDMTKHIGRRIASVDWGDRGIQIHLDDWTVLEFQVSEDRIDFKALGVNAEISPLEGNLHDAVFVHLAGQNFLWKRGSLLRSIFGKRFEGIHFCGARSCFLYVESVGILHLSILVTRKERQPFLFWWPSE